MSQLTLRDLTVERGGRPVVREVSVDIPAGQVTALLGPNGAGKSTLVLAVGGVLRPRAGSVLLEETDITGRRPERIRQAGVAIVPEGRRLLPDLTVEDNLRVASYALTREQAQAGRTRVLELFPQLAQRLSAPARTLSGGEQQMVVLAQALIGQPRYLLIDELSLGLAPVVVSRLIPVIAAVAESGTGVLLIEQFATVALGLAGHAHIMEGGRIRFSGPARELRDNPALLRSAYLLRGSSDQPAAVTPPPAVIPDLLGRTVRDSSVRDRLSRPGRTVRDPGTLGARRLFGLRNTGAMSNLSYSASVVVARSPEQMYDMVSDVTRMGEWSPVCTACWWDDGDGPRAGAWFTGRNELPERTWETRSQVVVADRGREFAWCVGGSWVRWGYTFAPVDGGTQVTESWEFLPDGIIRFHHRFGDAAEAQIADRTAAARQGIPLTLAAIKQAVESA